MAAVDPIQVLLPRQFDGAVSVPALFYDDRPDEQSLARVEFYVPSYMGSSCTFELMAAMPSLRVCQLLTAGYEGAVPFLPRGVVLCNAGGVHDASTAELAVGLAVAQLRGIDDFARAMPAGEWHRGRRDSLADRRVIVIGAGGVGRGIQRRLEAFEATVSMVGRTARGDVHAIDELFELLPDAEVVFVAVPLTDETRHLIDDSFLALLPEGALVVNVARGSVADTSAILRHCHRLRFALDVTDPEPLPADHALWQQSNVLISPHVGGNSTAFPRRALALVQSQLEAWAVGRPLSHRVALH